MRHLANMVKKVLEHGYTITETHRVKRGPVVVELSQGVIRYFVNEHEYCALDAADLLDDYLSDLR